MKRLLTDRLYKLIFIGVSLVLTASLQSRLPRMNHGSLTLDRTSQESLALAKNNSQEISVALERSSPSKPRQCAPPPTNLSSLPKKVRKNGNWGPCLRYDCHWNVTDCDTVHATNYYEGLPCCVHILRDLAKALDEAMCELGLEHWAAFGMLLGLTRNRRIIPWTKDNDYYATPQVLNALAQDSSRRVLKRHGLYFLKQAGTDRICAAPNFADGRLAQSNNGTGLVYADIFELFDKGHRLVDKRGCYFPRNVFYPIRALPVYNDSFTVQVPNQPETWLEGVFGEEWRVPDGTQAKHGNTNCYHTKKKPSRGPCGNGSVGNGACADSSLCCSEYGWCGTSAKHCKNQVSPKRRPKPRNNLLRKKEETAIKKATTRGKTNME